MGKLLLVIFAGAAFCLGPEDSAPLVRFLLSLVSPAAPTQAACAIAAAASKVTAYRKMAATATDIDLEAYHRGQSTPPSAQEVRSALRLLRTRRPHGIASRTPSKSKAAPALAWSKPTGGSTSGTPRAAAPHCLLTSACRCDRCSADYEELRLHPTSADKRPPTSVHTEVVGRTMVALSEDELTREGPVDPAAMALRTEVRCRLEDQFADLGVEQFADTVRTPRTPPSLAAAGRAAAGWVTAVAPVAPPRPLSQPIGWEEYYDDIASPPGGDDEDDDEGIESLASLRTQVALAAQRCKEINRLCVTELAQPDGAAETVRVNLALAAAGARGARATNDDDGGGGGDSDSLELAATVRSLAYPGCGAWAANPSGADVVDGAGQLGRTIRHTPGTGLPLAGGAAPAQDEVTADSASWRASASSSSPPACGQWLAERILASTSHLQDLEHGGGKGGVSGGISGGASLHQARHQSGRQRGSLHSPETLGPFGPAPSTPQREPPPPPPAGTNPFQEPTNPFSPPGGGLLLSRFSPPPPSSRVLACFGELGSRGGAAPARDGATTPPPEQRSGGGGHPRNPFSPSAPLDAPARNPFSPGAGTRFHHAASAADAAGGAFASFAARAAYASTTDAYTSDDDDHAARAATSRAERQRLVSVSLSPRRTQAGPAAAEELPPLPAEKFPPGTPEAEAAAGAAADAIAARDAAPLSAPGATAPTKPAAAPPATPATPATPAKQAAVDAAKRSAERRAAAARHRDEVRKYLAVERAASTVVTASFDSRQRRDALLSLTVRALYACACLGCSGTPPLCPNPRTPPSPSPPPSPSSPSPSPSPHPNSYLTPTFTPTRST